MNYTWTQTLPEAVVTVRVPKGTRGKDVQVEIKTSHLKIGLKGQPLLVDVRR